MMRLDYGTYNPAGTSHCSTTQAPTFSRHSHPMGAPSRLGARAIGCDNDNPAPECGDGEKRAELATGSISVAFSPDGRTPTASADRTVRLWDSVTGDERAVFKHQAQVGSIVFSRRGAALRPRPTMARPGSGMWPLARKGSC